MTIVVPSAILAEPCRVNAPEADVHECMFEDYKGSGDFDLCQFSESYQYISLDQGVPRCLSLLKLGGEIIIADCFRSKNYRPEVMKSTVGGGHPIANFRAVLESWPVAVISGTDITEQSAPSVEIEQGMSNILGFALPRVDAELKLKHPRVRWVLNRMVRLCLNERKRSRLDQRLDHQTRNRIASYIIGQECLPTIRRAWCRFPQ